MALGNAINAGLRGEAGSKIRKYPGCIIKENSTVPSKEFPWKEIIEAKRYGARLCLRL